MKRILSLVILFYALVIGLLIYNFRHASSEKHFTKSKSDKPAAFLQFHEGIRTRDGEATPSYPYNYKFTEFRKAKISNATRRISGRMKSNGVTEFKERGPANVPGRTRAVFNIPGDASNKTWLAGSATGGIWRTTNGGNTWSERSADFPALPISSFASDASGAVIYAGTGESVSTFYSSIGNGIFKSIDKGLTWQQLSSTNNNADFSIVTRLVVDPNNSNTIVATTVPHNLSKNEISSIMRSVDGGATWSKVLEVEGDLEQVIATPSNFNILYASENSKGIWKSTNGGVTWFLSSSGMSPQGRIEISVSPVNGSVVFAAAEGSQSGNGSDLYYSQDAGNSWSLVDVSFNNQVVDFFGGQGFYDNTILCDPFAAKSVYIGGVNLFKTSLTTGATIVDNYKFVESGTEDFLLLQAFAGVPFDNQRLDVGPDVSNNTIEIRFGAGMTQKAHRFLVPANRTNGVTPEEFTYQNIVDVPFEVWDVTQNRQLAVSFRDQNRNGKFDLVEPHLTNNGVDYLTNSREYVYIHNVTYSQTVNNDIGKTSGQEHKLMFNFFPALAEGSDWNENALPTSKLAIIYSGITKYNASTITVADAYGNFDNKNKINQADLTLGVHPDHHTLVPIIDNVAAKTFHLLLGNDGGVFVSKSSQAPGTVEGDWTFKGFGYNTGQFYGADKRPGSDQYIGGLQDNGTRISPANQVASATTNYSFAVDGDGFEVLWHSKDPSQILASRYYGSIMRSTNAGTTWTTSASGEDDDFPFVTKLAASKDFPDRVFTVAAKGVYVSNDFGATWQLTPINSKFLVGTSFFLDIEVSRANPNIVWAGSGMNNAGTIRNLHVSTDGGKTFAATNNYTNVVLGNITKLASHPTEPNTAFALFSFSNSPKILRTKDLGQTWEDISGFGTGPSSVNGFPDVAIYSLYVRPDDTDIIWAGTEIGIIESLDAGVSWHLLDGFPAVTVWDMKGQDNQVVIATHGRGIWTAAIESSQSPTVSAEVIAAGTDPDGNLAVRISAQTLFDSLTVFVNSQQAKKVFNIPQGDTDISIANVAPGDKTVKVFGYKNGIPVQSGIFATKHVTILSAKDSYSTYFQTLGDLVVSNMTLQELDGATHSSYKSLQTNHQYSTDQVYSILIRTPITISAALPKIFYTDIALVEPNDAVIVEATLNGLDWITLADYNSTLNELWTLAHASNNNGSRSMYVSHEIDYSGKLAPGEKALFRMRLLSNATTTGWGWSVESIHLQEIPTAVEDKPAIQFTLHPNPTTEFINVTYTLSQPSKVSINIFNAFGQNIRNANILIKNAGHHEATLNVSGFAKGSYVLMLSTDAGDVVRKFIVR
jgi:photosystem II stability/assembly factor-like uncharacterized protein